MSVHAPEGVATTFASPCCVFVLFTQLSENVLSYDQLNGLPTLFSTTSAIEVVSSPSSVTCVPLLKLIVFSIQYRALAYIHIYQSF